MHTGIAEEGPCIINALGLATIRNSTVTTRSGLSSTQHKSVIVGDELTIKTWCINRCATTHREE